MPVYLCKPGWNADEPWRHGVQVYDYPIPIPDNVGVSNSKSGSNNNNTMTHELGSLQRTKKRSSGDSNNNNNNNSNSSNDDQKRNNTTSNKSKNDPGVVVSSEESINEVVSRRVRHAEVVLVDEVSIKFERYWLRLRWPGPRGGIAGYIALGTVNSQNIRGGTTTAPPTANPRLKDSGVPSSSSTSNDIQAETHTEETNYTRPLSPIGSDNEDAPMITSGDEDDLDPIVPSSDGNMMLSFDDLNKKISSPDTPICESTGLHFPSSSAMQLLAEYDDGLVDAFDSVNSIDESQGEPVFCRICREGLHDVNYDTHDTDASFTSTHPYAQNPLLAPCQCTGSMAFVHYLCIEQWRCRSTHPTAKNGLNCETCGGLYTLPPPPSRPVNQTNDDWEAMPPHVLAALRRPHLAWQLGAAIVRRRWLRPLAPIIISPVVALYCRARRLLKKRGVSRRRWACSLCGRRARWKCVRCLRSYYCSRQCQNVSWHICHKHVCYKPARFWWSVVVYGLGTITCFPGILRDPFIYDLGILSVLLSFTVMGVIGGGIAQSLKKTHGVDIRGRTLELIVVLSTLILAWITWGLVWAFFGESNSCLGLSTFLWRRDVTDEKDLNISTLLSIWRNFLLRPAKVMLSMQDKFLMKMGPRVWKHLCVSNESGDVTNCLRLARRANPDFFLTTADNHGEKCGADLNLVSTVWMASAFIFVGGYAFKRREIRARGRHRPHQE